MKRECGHIPYGEHLGARADLMAGRAIISWSDGATACEGMQHTGQREQAFRRTGFRQCNHLGAAGAAARKRAPGSPRARGRGGERHLVA